MTATKSGPEGDPAPEVRFFATFQNFAGPCAPGASAKKRSAALLSVFCPDYIFKSVDRITPEFLRQQGITALVLDVDNTLTAHDSQDLAPGVARWLDAMR